MLLWEWLPYTTIASRPYVLETAECAAEMTLLFVIL